MPVTNRAHMPRLLLPAPAAALVGGVTIAFVASFAASAAFTTFTARDVVTMAVFAAAAVLSVEVSLRLAWPRARQDRLSRDFLGVWMLPVALLLPAVYVAAMVAATVTYVHLRAGRRSVLKLSYSIAAIGLAQIAAGEAHRLVANHSAASWTAARWTAAELGGGLRPIVAIVAALAASWIVNHVLVGGIVVATAGLDAVRGFFADREGAVLDVVDLSMGVLAALLWSVNPALLLFVVPPVLLVQHHVFSGLRKAVRTDLLTDLASATYWRENGAREVDRAWASGSQLAVMLIDVDHFKAVNDGHGHLAGDAVLAAVAHTVVTAVRPGDLVGRLGGEEFGVVLAGMSLPDAVNAAERVRASVADLRVRSDSGEWVGVTVSIGVAEMSVSGASLRALVDAADRALYEAKAAGRDTVRGAGPRAATVSKAATVIDLTSSTGDTAAPTRPAS